MKSSEFATAIYTLYPPFRAWDDVTLNAWTDTVVSECGDSVYSAGIRAQAFKTLTRVKHKEKPPQTATIIEHCRDAKRWREAQDEKTKLPIKQGPDTYYLKHPAWSDSRKHLADDLICGRNGSAHVGKQAAKDHYWITQLWDFCRENQKLPSDAQIATLKREAKEVDDVFASFAPGNGPASKLGMWAIQTATEKRNQLCDMVLHGVVRP
jgi:hypothetical protein